jgi:FlaA1/EpsC-like NDP-sugar epimerase
LKLLGNKILNVRGALAFLHDVAAAVIAWAASYWLRLNLEIPEYWLEGMLRALPAIVALQAACFLGFGLYRGIWRYASLPDLKRIVQAVTVAGMVAPIVFYMLRFPAAIPRAVLVLDPIILIMLMAGSRILYRGWKERRLYGIRKLRAKPVLVLGAGDAGVNLLKELSVSREWRVVGFLDDKGRLQKRELQGIPIYGTLEQLPEFAQKLEVENAIVAMPSASTGVRRRAIEICAAANVRAMTVPSFDDLVSGRLDISAIRNVELDDLLGREAVELDTAGLQNWLEQHVVMVSGAGGSIGSELCRQIARFRPKLLVLFELNEFALYQIQQEFEERFPELSIVCAIGDVKNRERVSELLTRYSPSVIFHAAAYKHVPLMERENAWQAVENNVIGTVCLAQCAQAHGVEKFVFVSTDKAVNPVNVMGATKRMGEMVCQSLQDGGTRFVMVRFGNVLGSAGSVIPKFREQIAKGGPVTVTHPEITRYFMSIPEAAQLVLQAGLMGKGGEIFALEMGEPVKIADLARDMIRLSGLSDEDIEIVYTGLRPGEKFYEEVLADDETSLPTPHSKLRIAKARPVEPQWLNDLLRWVSAYRHENDDTLKRELMQWIAQEARVVDLPVTAAVKSAF